MNIKPIGWSSYRKLFIYFAIISVFVIGISVYIGNEIHEDPAYQVAVYAISHNEDVHKSVGDINKLRIMSAYSKSGDNSGKAEYLFSANGSKANRVIHIVLTKHDGIWSVTSLSIKRKMIF